MSASVRVVRCGPRVVRFGPGLRGLLDEQLCGRRKSVVGLVGDPAAGSVSLCLPDERVVRRALLCAVELHLHAVPEAPPPVVLDQLVVRIFGRVVSHLCLAVHVLALISGNLALLRLLDVVLVTPGFDVGWLMSEVLRAAATRPPRGLGATCEAADGHA